MAFVDESDYELVSAYRWRPLYGLSNGQIYALAVNRGAAILMHRLVAGTPDGFDTDHINANGLDNRRANLRVATKTQNAANARKRAQYKGKPTSSRFKGVTLNRRTGKWRAFIQTPEKRNKSLGSFSSEVEAAKAYDRVAVAQWGPFARPNFPAEVSAS